MYMFWVVIPSILFILVILPKYVSDMLSVPDLVEPFIIVFKLMAWWFLLEALGPFSLITLVYCKIAWTR